MDSARVGRGRNMPLLANPDPAIFCREKPSIGGRAVRRQRGKGGREEGTDWSTLRRTSRVSAVLASSRRHIPDGWQSNHTIGSSPHYTPRPAPRPHEPRIHYPLSMPRYAALSSRHLHFPWQVRQDSCPGLHCLCNMPKALPGLTWVTVRGALRQDGRGVGGW